MQLQISLSICRKIGLLFLLFSNQAFAGEYKHSAGLGLQYGMLGYQLAYLSDDMKYYGAIGAGSVAIGAQKFVDQAKKHALGINLGRIFVFSNIAGLTYNYSPEGMYREGMVFGIELGRMRSHSDNIADNLGKDLLSIFGLEYDEDRVSENYVSVNVAYQF